MNNIERQNMFLYFHGIRDIKEKIDSCQSKKYQKKFAINFLTLAKQDQSLENGLKESVPHEIGH